MSLLFNITGSLRLSFTGLLAAFLSWSACIDWHPTVSSSLDEPSPVSSFGTAKEAVAAHVFSLFWIVDFVGFFSSVSEQSPEGNQQSELGQDSRELQIRQDTAVIETVASSVEGVRCVLSQIKSEKYPVPDGIPGLVIMELSTELAKPISAFFELSMRTGGLPLQWKSATFVALHKEVCDWAYCLVASEVLAALIDNSARLVSKCQWQAEDSCASFDDDLPGGLRFGDQLIKVKDKCVTNLSAEEVIGYCKQFSEECEVFARPSALTDIVTMSVPRSASAGIVVKGGVIEEITAGSPAAEAGVLLGHRIIKINDKNVTHLTDVDLLARLDEADQAKALMLAPRYIFESQESRPPATAGAGGDCVRVQSEEQLAGAENDAGGYKMDIAALCETHFSEQRQLEEVDADFTFFRGGYLRRERRDTGDVPAMSAAGHQQPPYYTSSGSSISQICQHYQCLRPPSPITSLEEAKNNLYENLHAFLETVSKVDHPVILDEFSARVGTDQAVWIGVLGPHGIGGCDGNGLLLRNAKLRRTGCGSIRQSSRL
ncbi:hypothetical protein SprV_0802644400 [Sparganum proliferum]